MNSAIVFVRLEIAFFTIWEIWTRNFIEKLKFQKVQNMNGGGMGGWRQNMNYPTYHEVEQGDMKVKMIEQNFQVYWT